MGALRRYGLIIVGVVKVCFCFDYPHSYGPFACTEITAMQQCHSSILCGFKNVLYKSMPPSVSVVLRVRR